jgi:hypothetical protein
MAADRNVRATLGVGLLVGGPALSAAVWGIIRSDTPPPVVWRYPIFVLGIVGGVAGIAILLTLLPWTRWLGRDSAPGDLIPLEEQVLDFVKHRARTLTELQALTGAGIEFVHASTEALEAKGKVKLQGSEVSIRVSPAVEHDQAMRIKPVKSEPGSGGRVTRREILYDDEGREAGEEVVRESRDAIAKPKTVEAKGDVPQPTVQVSPGAIDKPPTVHPPSISQGDRPGWRAWSEIDPQQGHGAVLNIKSLGEGVTVFRCRVTHLPVGGFVDWTHRATRSPSQTRVHYPAAFPGAPSLVEGEYQFTWFGYVEGNPNELLLATNAFKVNQLGQVYPHE